MTPFGLAELLGWDGKRMRWERPLLFFAALFIGELVWLLLAPSIFRSGADAPRLTFFNFAGADQWLMMLSSNMLLALAAALAFRWIPDPWLASLASAFGYVLVDRPAEYLLRLFHQLFTQSHNLRAEWIFDPLNIVLSLTWVFLVLAGISLALKLVRQPLPALLAGAAAGSLVNRLLSLLVSMLRNPKLLASDASPINLSWFVFLVVGLVSTLLSMLAFWGLLRLSSGRSLGREASEPRISRSLFLGGLLVAYGIPVLVVGAGAALFLFKAWNTQDLFGAVALYLAIWVLLILGIVLFAVLIHRMWAAIQDGQARTTPGRAVGMLFVPLYNLYWGFQVLPGFATDYNAFLERYAVPAPRLGQGLFVAYMVLCLASLVPLVGLVLLPASLVVQLAMVSRICRALNALPPVAA